MLIRVLARIALPMLVLQACASIDVGKDFDEKKVAEIKIGSTDKAQIQSWFGQPVSRFRMDGKETWTYQRVQSSAGMSGSGAAKTAGASIAAGAVSMIPIVGALAGPVAGMAIAPSATDMQAASNGKTLTVTFGGDLVVGCQLTLSRSGGKMMDAMTASDTDITTCH
jgi:hypothetical protein